MTIDELRAETVPLLREVKSSVERLNREIDRVDVVLESTGTIVGRVEKLSGLMEEAAGSPLVKLISFGAGLRQGVSKAGKGRGKAPAAAALRQEVREATIGAPALLARARRRLRRDGRGAGVPLEPQAGEPGVAAGDRAGGARRHPRSQETRQRVGRGGQARDGRARDSSSARSTTSPGPGAP